MTSDETTRPIDPQVRIGHVHLKVADLERALRFYCGVLGFELTQRYGTQAAFVSAGGYHHHIGLNTWESLGGSPPPPGTTGLYHTAILYPTRRALADALRRVLDAGIPLDGASDHGVSEALYLRDPDDNGVELYWDRPQEAWPRTPQGELAMFTRRLDLNGLLKEVEAERNRPEGRRGATRLVTRLASDSPINSTLTKTAAEEQEAPMDLQLTNKKALVTGSTAGIGFAIASLLAQEGAAVVVNGRSQGRVEEAVRRIKKENKDAQVTGVAADLGTKEGVDLLTESSPGAGHPGEQPRHLRGEAVPRHHRRGLAAVLRGQRPQRRAPEPLLPAGDAPAELGPDRLHLQRVGREHPGGDDPLRRHQDGADRPGPWPGRDDRRDRT